jgi:hypothetical protein
MTSTGKKAPEGAVRANEELTGRTFASWDAEQRAAREVERREAKLRRRREREED